VTRRFKKLIGFLARARARLSPTPFFRGLRASATGNGNGNGIGSAHIVRMPCAWLTLINFFESLRPGPAIGIEPGTSRCLGSDRAGVHLRVPRLE
jgi:hypothetical protein